MCRTYFDNLFYDLAWIFIGHLWHTIAKWNSKKKMVENVTNKDFCHFKTWPKCIGMSFLCLWSMDYRTAWNGWKVLLDAEISVFAWFYGVLVPSIPSTFSCERKLPLFVVAKWPDYGFRQLVFGVCLWQSLNNSSGHLSNTQRHRMTIENRILDGQVHTLCPENKTM